MTTLQLKRRQATGKLADNSFLSPLLRHLYELRGIQDLQEVDFHLKHLVSPQHLPDINKAVKILEEARHQNLRILIVGDYDTDGTTGTVVLHRALRMLGFKYVDYIVPDRFRFGYGLSVGIVEDALRYKKPDLIITVDNGIASIEGVARAKAAEITVIITDHHLAGTQLPIADAIVNPNLPDSDFPSHALAGVGVAFYVVIALRRHFIKRGLLDGKPPRLDGLLDLVALGTVADVVSLDANNRILVEQGLRRIRKRKSNPGIRALLQVAKRNPEKVTASDLAYIVAPCINAAGRLKDTSVGIACLLADDEKEAFSLAQNLHETNKQRKEITEQMQAEAMQVIEQNRMKADTDSSTQHEYCLFDSAWHEGIIGLIASRLKEDFRTPMIVFAQAENGILKGSARSIEGIHIRDLLAQIATQYPNLIIVFGGHAMAAGLSITADNYIQFKEVFEQELRILLENNSLNHFLLTDGDLDVSEISYQIAQELCYAAPWGKDFPEPVFDGIFEVKDKRLLANRHLQLHLQTEGNVLRGIYFNIIGHSQDKMRQFDLVSNTDKIRIAYRLNIDEYQNRRSVMLNIQHIESAS